MVFTRYIAAYLENFRRGDKMAFRFIRIPVKRLIIPFLPNKMRNNGEGAVVLRRRIGEKIPRSFVRSILGKKRVFARETVLLVSFRAKYFFPADPLQLFIRRVSGSAATRPTI